MVGKAADVLLEGSIVQLFADIGDPGDGSFVGVLERFLLFGGKDSLLVDGGLSLLVAFLFAELSGLMGN